MTKKENSTAKQPKALQVSSQTGESEEQALARVILQPSVAASLTVLHWKSTSDHVDQTCLVQALNKQAEQASAGDLSRGEAMLMSQAHALDAIFNRLAVFAKQNRSQTVEVGDTLLRLVLRAQAQSRATIETLAEIKNPASATFVRQANIAHGPQQVNNAPQTAVARAEATEIPQTQTIGADPWRTAGHWNGGPGSQQRSGNGDRGMDRRDRALLKAELRLPGMPIAGASELSSGASFTRYARCSMAGFLD